MDEIRNISKIKNLTLLAKTSCFKIDRKFDFAMKMSGCLKKQLNFT